MPPAYRGVEPRVLRECADRAHVAHSVVGAGSGFLDRLPNRDRFDGRTADQIAQSWAEAQLIYRDMAEGLASNRRVLRDMADWLEGRLRQISRAREACEYESLTKRRIRDVVIAELGSLLAGDPREAGLRARIANLETDLRRLNPGWEEFDVEWVLVAREFGLS